MRAQALPFLLFALSAVSAFAEASDPAPMTCTQLIAWTAAGVPSQRLDRLAHQRGLAFPVDTATSNSLSEAGVASVLLQSLRAIAPAGSRRVSGTACARWQVGPAEELP